MIRQYDYNNMMVAYPETNCSAKKAAKQPTKQLTNQTVYTCSIMKKMC